MKYPQYSLGLITGFFAAALYFMAPAILDSFKKPAPQSIARPIASKGIFKIVDHYKDCDVIQYQYGLLSEYKYFLDCPK